WPRPGRPKGRPYSRIKTLPSHPFVWLCLKRNATIVFSRGAESGISMAGINHVAAEGSPRELAFSRAAEARPKPRPLTAGGLIRAALLGWLLAFLVGASCLLAGEKGNVMGTVAGPSQTPIPGAKVTLAGADGSRQSATADQSGHYSFPAVDPGTYTLSAEAAGYQAATRTAVLVTGGTSTTVDLLLVATAPPGPGQALPVP